MIDPKSELQKLKCNLFARRDTVNEAMIAATDFIEGINSRDRGVAYTALYIVVNTMAHLEENRNEI